MLQALVSRDARPWCQNHCMQETWNKAHRVEERPVGVEREVVDMRAARLARELRHRFLMIAGRG